MSGIVLRVLIYAIIFGAIYFGFKRIVADWKGRFRQLDKDKLERDIKERQRPDVVELERGEDGIYRPSGDKDRNNTSQ